MQRWSYGTNNLYKSSSVWLEEGPWWAFALYDAVDIICAHMPDWKIPFVDRIKIVREDEPYTFAEYYGDTLHYWWDGFVVHPVFQWCYSHIKTIPVEIPWEQCRKLFSEKDKAAWDEMEADPEFGKFSDPSKLEGDDLALYNRVRGTGTQNETKTQTAPTP